MMVRSLREQKRLAAEAGIIVRTVRRTGEIRFIGPDDDEPPITVNHRRKDGTREVERLIEKHRKDDTQ